MRVSKISTFHFFYEYVIEDINDKVCIENCERVARKNKKNIGSVLTLFLVV